MKKLIIPVLSVVAIAATSCNNGQSTTKEVVKVDTAVAIKEIAADTDNVLSDAEKADGWKLLFNGSSKDGWHGYKGKTTDTWVAEKGLLHCLGSATDKSDKRADLTSDSSYDNFELNADWKLAPKGNSGIMYLVSEEFEAPYLSGPEYQIIDDKNFPEKLEDWQKTGANYAMNPPLVAASNPIGEWNHTKIIVNKGHVEHWLNGQKTAEYTMGSPEWKKNKETGKWKDAKGYGMTKKGKIALQDHGSEIWFKNVKVKELK
ncbi:uncharacterized protein DUF1080 [Chitinophaga dinghuensis]|uniref:Uncharacterized protein DUF1080 n=1 Tax=Chitinophaga dinghuensis TaxID=1539050 RepID=A0A327W5K2_9BACT|nr:DUF1080 domain-containing protein [Chitinophaga dinghuensis]RAJ85777.1 uncharacterized protein DUF1080 [Chitinophaga dinghuensis]